METAKSQLRLRTLDAKGRPVGTDRSSLIPSEGNAFRATLAQGLNGVQGQEARARRTGEHAVNERAAERRARAARDAETSAASAEERRETQRTRIDERRERREPGRAHDAGNGAPREADPRPAGTIAPEEWTEAPFAPTAIQPNPQRDTQPDHPTGADRGAPGSGSTGPTLQAPVRPPAGASAQGASVPRSLPGAPPSATVAPQGAAASNAPAVAEEIATQRPAPVRRPGRSSAAPTTQDVERAEAVLRQVRVALQPGLRSATLQLHPAELGRVSIRLRVRDDSVHATVRAESEAALSVLERHLPELRAMLAQQGFVGAELDLGLAGDGELDGGGADEQARPPAGAAREETPLTPVALALPLSGALGGVDLFA